MGTTIQTENALISIGNFLHEVGYSFTAITPTSHALVNARHIANGASSLRDIFGWSRPFAPNALPSQLLMWLEEAGELERDSGLLHSNVRYSTLGGSLYVHSSFPTKATNSVFFGPDTYRFANLLQRTMATRPTRPIKRILDLGCGSGAGGLFLAGLIAAQRIEVFLSDINEKALRYAKVNAEIAERKNVITLLGDLTQAIKGPFDIIVSNPPFLVDAEARVYRDGGGISGCDLSVRIVRESIPLLTPGGVLILYTGTPVLEGRYVFLDAMAPMLYRLGIRYEYAEIDPDVFGDELAHAAYASADRIAAVSLVVYR